MSDDHLRDAAEVLKNALAASGITQTEIARRLILTEGRVSQILSGKENLTVGTVSRFLRAIDYDLRIEAARPGAARADVSTPSPPNERLREKFRDVLDLWGVTSNQGPEVPQILDDLLVAAFGVSGNQPKDAT